MKQIVIIAALLVSGAAAAQSPGGAVIELGTIPASPLGTPASQTLVCDDGKLPVHGLCARSAQGRSGNQPETIMSGSRLGFTTWPRCDDGWEVVLRVSAMQPACAWVVKDALR